MLQIWFEPKAHYIDDVIYLMAILRLLDAGVWLHPASSFPKFRLLSVAISFIQQFIVIQQFFYFLDTVTISSQLTGIEAIKE